jgi:hypothetical protein
MGETQSSSLWATAIQLCFSSGDTFDSTLWIVANAHFGRANGS